MGDDSILLVDDVPANLRALSVVLQDLHVHIRIASSGEDAIEAFERDPVDLVLLDIRMPGMDGFQTCQILRESVGGEELPVIFISAVNDLESRIRGFQAGGTDYVTKPFNAEEVLARVRMHLELKRLRSKLEHQVEKRTTELRENNRALRESRDRYQQFFDRNVYGFLVQDSSGRIVDCNESFVRMSAYDLTTIRDIVADELFVRDGDSSSVFPQKRELITGEGKAVACEIDAFAIDSCDEGRGVCWVIRDLGRCKG